MKGVLQGQFTGDWESLIQLTTLRRSWSKIKLFVTRYMMQATVHALWMERNRRKHDEKPTPNEVLEEWFIGLVHDEGGELEPYFISSGWEDLVGMRAGYPVGVRAGCLVGVRARYMIIKPGFLLSLSSKSTEKESPKKRKDSSEEEEDDATKMDSSSSERLRSGRLVDIKKEDAIDLFQTMLRSRPLPAVIDFNRVLLGLVAKSRHHFHVLGLCKRMELQGIAYDLDTLNIMINSLCRRRKISSAFAVFGKILKLGYKPDSETFNTLFSVLSLKGRVF
uniref:Pentatricopeptide repeat-containing protein n=1 Tax=Brassica oleracea var. oleracea TaxID=109376 RepID=A0A0D3DWN8_BRAOL